MASLTLGNSAPEAAAPTAPAADGKDFGWASEKLQLVAFLRTNTQEKSTRKINGKETPIVKPKLIVGARVKFLIDYPKVPKISLDPSVISAKTPYVVPKSKDIALRPVKKGEVVDLNLLELSVLLATKDFNQRFVTEKQYEGYATNTRPGVARDPKEKKVRLHEGVIGQYRQAKTSAGEPTVRFILSLEGKADEAQEYREFKNAIPVLDATGHLPASPELAGFIAYAPARTTRTPGGKSGQKTLASNPGVLAFQKLVQANA